MDITIDPEFRDLLPRLADEEYQILEQEIIAEKGARNPLILWNDTLIDGHNRLEICTKHNLPYKTEQSKQNFKTRFDAMHWIWRNALGTRNLSALQKGKLALTFEAKIKEQARERQAAAGGDKKSEKSLRQKSAEAILEPKKERFNSRDELARIADVSHDTISKVRKITQSAVAKELEAKIESKEMSISAASEIAGLPEVEAREALSDLSNLAVKKAKERMKEKKSKQPKYIGELRKMIREIYEFTRQKYGTLDYVDLQRKCSTLKDAFYGAFGE